MYRIQIFAFCKLDSYNGDYDTKERKENVMKMKRYLCFSLAGLMLLSSGCGSKGKGSNRNKGKRGSGSGNRNRDTGSGTRYAAGRIPI